MHEALHPPAASNTGKSVSFIYANRQDPRAHLCLTLLPLAPYPVRLVAPPTHLPQGSRQRRPFIF